MSILILWKHDQQRVVGKLEGNVATFDPPLHEHYMLEAGWRTLEAEIIDGERFIRRAEILELSVGWHASERSLEVAILDALGRNESDPRE